MSTVLILTSLLRKKQQAVHTSWNQTLQWLIREVFEEDTNQLLTLSIFLRKKKIKRRLEGKNNTPERDGF